MNRNNGVENANRKKENEASKIPKSAKFSTAKEKSSTTVQSSKTTVRTITVHSSKEKQTQIASHHKNEKTISIVKTSKDIKNHFLTENRESDDPTTENATRIPFFDKENTTKRVLQKEISSQTSQKQSGSLPKKPSMSDLKKSTAFGGMKFTSKRISYQKTDIFQTLKKESKSNFQDKHPTESGTTTKAVDSDKPTVSKDLELPDGNLENPRPNEAKSSKVTSLKLKETNHLTAYGGIRFAPKWKSTPIRPDIFDRIQKESKTDDLESYPAESFTKELKKIPDYTKIIKKPGTQRSAVEKLKAPSIQKPESSKNGGARNGKEVFAKPEPTYAGLRFSIRPKKLRDVFEARKVKIGNQAEP